MTTKKRITIIDVAARSGVSKSTVSRVLRGDGDTSDAVRTRVTSAAQKLGYHPSMLAGAMRSRRSYSIGLLIPDIANPFFPEIARAVQRVAEERGYMVILANSDWREDRECRYLDLARRYHLDGIIINPVHISAQELAKLGCPVVVIGSRAQYHAFDCVSSDTRSAVQQAIQHLVSKGHARIGLVAGAQGSDSARSRVDAFRAEMKSRRLPIRTMHTMYAEFSREGGIGAARKIATMRDRVTAVVCGNDLIALGVMAGASDAGLRVPQDLAVVGIDNIDAATDACPPLTTISKDKAGLGERAATLLIDRIEGALRGCARRELLATNLIVRGSVAQRM